MAVTTLRVKVGDRWYTVEISDLTASPLQVTVDGETFQVEVEGLAPQQRPRHRRGRRPPRELEPPSPQSTPGGAAASASDNMLCSPMPGRVISIMVRPGERVSAGQEVCVVEAMKMEQSIHSPRDGVIKAIHVQPMDPVNASDPLIELE